MTDCFSKEKRSEVMSKIRSNNTRVEKMVFSELRKRGIYFQKHYKKVLGKPDIALPRKKIAIFLDGDFWHGRDFNETNSRLPEKYWLPKILRNINRDKDVNRTLRGDGWKVMRIWEGDILNEFEKNINKIIQHLEKVEYE